MAVVYYHEEGNPHHPALGDKCSICEKVLSADRYPCITYFGNLFICCDCTVRNADGLTADFIELRANVALRKVQPGMRLWRVSKDEPARRFFERERIGAEIMAKFKK